MPAARVSFRRGPAGKIAALVVLAVGCSSLRVPLDPPEISPSERFAGESDGLVVRAAPIVGRERYWDIFDENLPQSDVAALWIELHNRRRSAVTSRGVRWFLRTGDRNAEALAAREVLNRYYGKRGVRYYSTEADRAALARLDRLSLQFESLAPSGAAAGFLFFRIPPESESAWFRDAALVGVGLSSDRRSKTPFMLPLRYASP